MAPHKRWLSRFAVASVLCCIACPARSSEPASAAGLAGIEVQPPAGAIAGPLGEARFVVTGRYADGSLRDLTRDVSCESTDTSIAKVAAGVVRPVADGTAVVKISVGDRTAEFPVIIFGISGAAPVSFANQVVPMLTKTGCNQGACHGSQYGKGGFKLSLFGFDPEPDYEAIVKQAEGRRIVRSQPDESLVLIKPTLQTYHGGSRRFDAESYAYELILSWLQQGAPAPREDEPHPQRIEVFPQQRVLADGDQQQLVVLAHYSDGSREDVTRKAQFDSLSEGIAEVDPAGLVTIHGRGALGIMVRYLGQAELAALTVPFNNLEQYPAFPARNFIDELAAAQWKQLGLLPSEPAGDATFLRRAFLDAIGTLPGPDMVREFLASQEPDKREKLIDRLLGLLPGEPWRYQDEWVSFWTIKWGDLLRNSSNNVGEQGMWALHNWIRESLRVNKPVSKMAAELLTATGSTYSNGPANYYRVARSPEDLAETTAQVFLGVRLQCARCHHHPFEKYSQEDYYGMAAFFARVRTKGNEEFGLFGGGQDVFVSSSGDVRHPRKRHVVPPAPLDAGPVETGFDRRRALADWLTSPDNRLFARNFVNRFWGYFMGRGLVDPIDDMRGTNPATNPALLDALAKDFAEHGYDLKHLMRTIMNSRTYQLSSAPNETNGRDDRFFSHYLVKRLSAEQLLDAVNFATGTVEKFPNLPLADVDRAIKLPDPSIGSYFLDVFGRPPRESTCECERVAVPNITQALHLANSEFVNGKVTAKEGRVAQLLAREGMEDSAVVEELYLAALSRLPTEEEQKLAMELVAEAPSRQEGYQDLLWALCNTKEFMFNH